MTKIKTINKNVHGKKVILPIVGEVNVSAEGVAEVPENVAAMMTKGEQWSYHKEEGEEIETPGDKDEEETGGNTTAPGDEDQEDDIVETDEEDEVKDTDDDEEKVKEEELKEVRAQLRDQLTLQDMIDVAKAHKISKANIEKYGKNKVIMAKYLIDKIGIDKVKELLKK